MALEPLSRRMLLTTMGAVAGAAALGSRLAMAQTPPPSGPATPLSTVTTPPRDFGPNAPPSTYVDPDVITVDPLFDRYRQGNTPLKRLWTGALWSEGPAWCSQGRYLVWSDIPNNRQLRWLEDNGRVSVFRMPSNNSNGNTFDFQGRQISCEHLTRRVVRYENDGAVTILADSFNGKRLNSPNDVVAHPDGSYWFTDPPYGGQLYEGTVDAPGGATNQAGRIKNRLGQPPEVANLKRELPNSVYRVDPSGKVDLLVSEDQVPNPNGLVFSPDYKKLYVISTGRGPGDAHAGATATSMYSTWAATTRFPTAGSSVTVWSTASSAGPTAPAVTWTAISGCSSNGGRNLGYSGVTVWTPEGKLIGRIRLPEVCGNIAFGGPKRNRLFMAASQSLYALYVATQGAGPA